MKIGGVNMEDKVALVLSGVISFVVILILNFVKKKLIKCASHINS